MQRLRALIIEDADDDAQLLLRELSRGGFEVISERVETAAGLEAALDRTRWDIIFADYSMPRFTGTEALEMVRRRGLDVPFIFVSGTIGEDTAVSAMKAGANDYLMKGQLKRLMPAVQRELQEARAREERRQAEAARRAAEARFGNVLATAPDAIISVDEEHRIVLFNQGAERIFGYQAPQVLGQPVDILIPDRFVGAHRQHVSDFSASGTSSRAMNERGDVYGKRKDGTVFPAEASISKLTQGGRTTYTVILRDVTEQKQAEDQIRFLAHYDPLTGLPNRTLFADRLQQAMIEAERHHCALGVMLLDMDRFKTINDTLGHTVGDKLLKAAAERLLSCLREGDTIARIGGDEFTILLPDLTHVDGAGRVAQKIIDSFQQPFLIDQYELFAGVSVGITLFPMDDTTIEGLIKNADTAMYRAKESGRNNYQFYTAEMTAKAAERLSLENGLRQAIARNELTLAYQPQVDLGTGEIIGVEALLRWNHPQFGAITPTQFIPVAEETGLIVPIGEWVINEACRQCKTWLEMGVPPIHVAVNLSARQFLQPNLTKAIQDTLAATGLDPHHLEIEITETTLMENVDQCVSVLRELAALGVAFSVDDFGTGYSSLGYLKRFPLHKIKIDRSFVEDVTSSPDAAAIATAIIALSHSLGTQVVAEGVETGKQLRFLLQRDCDAIQGFFFSTPVDAANITRMLLSGERLTIAETSGAAENGAPALPASQ